MALALLLFAACSNDYRNAIPKGSTAVVAFDASELLGKGGAESPDGKSALGELLHTDDFSHCGIDLEKDFYGFETADGTFGVVLPVKSEGDLETWLTGLADDGIATSVSEKKGYKFTTIAGLFIVGYSSSALVAIGPVMPLAHGEATQRMAKWLDAGDDDGIKTTQLYEKLESTEGFVRLVARSDALPEQLSAALTIGTPKGTTPKEVYVGVGLQTTASGYLAINGGSFSFDTNIDKALYQAKSAYKSIKGDLLSTVPSTAAFFMACGVEGDDYLQLLRSNETVRSLLFGMNTTLDIDKMLRSVDGDLLFCLNEMSETPVFSLLAEQDNDDWLKDVGYWKRSCPTGTTITDGASPSTFRLQSNDWNVGFGIDQRGLLFVNNLQGDAAGSVHANANGLPAEIVEAVKGKRLAIAVNVAKALETLPFADALAPMVKSLAGPDGIVLYTIE